MFFTFDSQIILSVISILQDSFRTYSYDKTAFQDKQVISDTVDEFFWKNNQLIEGSLYITEKEPFEIQQFPQINIIAQGGEFKNLDFGQYMDKIKTAGVRTAEIIGGGGEFDIVVKCCAESTSARKKLCDLTAANLLIHRADFFKFYGVTFQTLRRGSSNETAYLVGDKRIYWQELIMHCFGEWDFPVIKDPVRLGRFIIDTKLTRGTVKSSVELLWNIL